MTERHETRNDHGFPEKIWLREPKWLVHPPTAEDKKEEKRGQPPVTGYVREDVAVTWKKQRDFAVDVLKLALPLLSPTASPDEVAAAKRAIEYAGS